MDNHMLSSPHKPVVLVAEDEPQLREVLNLILTKDGFDTWLACDGREATEIYEAHRDDIDVVLMDLHLPRLDGLGAFLMMRDLNPDVLCCFMTGGGDWNSEDFLLLAGASFILQKPFGVNEVSQILRHIMQAQPNRN